VERAGTLVDAGITLTREEILLALERMQAGTGHPLSALNPMVEVRLAHARVTAVHERIALGGPSLTIRLRSRTPLTAEDLLRKGMLPAQLWEFLCACLAGGANIVIAGETGSGKTTLAQALLAALPAHRRIVTVEDPIEFALERPWVEQLEVAHPDLGGQGGVSARALVRLCLRLRPDHIVVGEVRDEAAWDMLDAMSVGHSGSLSTVHAGSPRGALQRLEHLSMRAGQDAPLGSVRSTLVEAINLIVVVRRRVETNNQVRRVVVAVSEVCGLEGDLYRVQDLVSWQGFGLRTTGLGLSERLTGRLKDAGYTLPSLGALGVAAGTRGDVYKREDRAQW
jgi:pilus assembly protein CpaF